jgi:uncharacterized repeat protein (TIGR03803 family)
MQSKKLSLRLTLLLAMFAMAMIMTVTLASAQTETVLFTFGPDESNLGAMPKGGLVRDAAGNLYGTTEYGGDVSDEGFGFGTAFELSPAAGGGWTETILHNFGSSGNDGLYPESGLILDAAGNLYGTTYDGGTYSSGTVFELSPAAGGGWSEKTLHSFNNNGKDGINPIAGLAFDSAGNLYGTTYAGGPNYCYTSGGITYNCGIVFELSPETGGAWTEKRLHAFSNNGTDGFNPITGVIVDAKSNLYGASTGGGVHNLGMAYQLTPNASGNWTERLLHSFANNGHDGWGNPGRFIFDAFGNLYNTTSVGGIGTEYGTVYELSPEANGSWSEKVLFRFEGGNQGQNPETGVVFDAAGNLYGTTFFGGPNCRNQLCGGTVFKLTPNGSGGWTDTVLYGFSNSSVENPNSPLVLDDAGNLYGTTSGETASGGGTVYEVTP